VPFLQNLIIYLLVDHRKAKERRHTLPPPESDEMSFRSTEASIVSAIGDTNDLYKNRETVIEENSVSPTRPGLRDKKLTKELISEIIARRNREKNAVS
jgi:hypothetical protein